MPRRTDTGESGDDETPGSSSVASDQALDVPLVSRLSSYVVQGARGLQVNPGAGNTQINYYHRPPRSLSAQLIRLAVRPSRFAVEVFGVFLMSVLALAVKRLPAPVLPDPRWPLAQNTAAGLCLSLAVTIALLAGTKRDRRSARLLASATALVLVLVSAITGMRWLASGTEPCLTMMIPVSGPLLPGTKVLLAEFQAENRSRHCVNSLELVPLGDDLSDRLRDAGTPIMAAITSDPAVLAGLNGGWQNLEVLVSRQSGWQVIGLDPATVYLKGHPSGSAVDITDLDQLQVPAITPPDPVVMAVRKDRGKQPTPRLEPRQLDLVAQPCPSNTILPGSWKPSCGASQSHPRAVIEDAHNPIGAPVFGILMAPLTTAGAATRDAQSLTQAFLDWLRSRHKEFGLDWDNDSAATALDQSRLLLPLAEPEPTHVSVILDASLSMGRSGDGAGYGAAHPWDAARTGLTSWADGDSLDPQDSLTVIVSHLGTGIHPAKGYLAGSAHRRLVLPGTVPGGQTGLGATLATVRSIQRQAAFRHQRSVIVLLTDGVNVFTEQRPQALALAHVDVVLIKDGNGCPAVPAAVRDSCLPASTTGDDVAAQLAALTTKTHQP